MRLSILRACCWAILAISLSASVASADPVVTKLIKKPDGGFELQRAGQPYFILGAGGDASKQLLKDSGGNSFRTWGADGIDAKLDEARKLGLTVTIGIWLQHESGSWKYSDAAKVKEQLEMAKKAILKYKDNPALLMWGIGNEMEGYKEGDDPLIWNAVEEIAKFAHDNDPNHPTMTVIAEIGGKKIPSINQYCPDIDVVGINSYGGGPSLAARYRAGGGVKPFVVTEFGPPGSWESGKNAWNAPTELTSTAKGAYYRKTYENTIAAEKGKLCLGSYAFAWGNKREATATWYGIFLSDGTRLEALDQLNSLWTEKPLVQRCPQIQPLKASADKVKPGGDIHVTLDVTHPTNKPMKVKWILQQDPAQYNTNGETQPEPQSYPESIINGDLHGCDLKMPADGGGFWLYAYVTDDQGNSAVANMPLFVDGAPPKFKARVATLPLQLYSDDTTEMPYVWSGWMGKTDAIAMDPKCTDNPHTGQFCMKCDFKATNGFGGIIWQSPANDWGDLAGGFNLTGAKRLSFWARGENGDEAVSFKVGIIGSDKKYPDSVKTSLDVVLDKEWKQYSIDLTGKDLSCVKSGFGWVVAPKGKAITFYLDDIQYDATPGQAQSVPHGDPAQLPFTLYQDDMTSVPYVWSGWMGDTASIAMDEKCDDNPHSGKVCMKCEFKADKGFGGIVWQSPANDWGDKPGGYDLTGAKKLTFWARGETGEEVVSFSLGLLGKDKKHHDSDSAKLADQKLSKDWTQYTIDLTGKDLTDIKTGFCWVVGSKGKPVTFYLDDIKYE
jgi:hypothetical protein